MLNVEHSRSHRIEYFLFFMVCGIISNWNKLHSEWKGFLFSFAVRLLAFELKFGTECAVQVPHVRSHMELANKY